MDMDTCGAIVLTIDPEDRDGWTQQIVDRNKKCCGAKSGHLGHLIELQMKRERQIKELVNIEKLEVAEIMLQEAIAQTTEIIYAGWLDDVARRTPEDLTADRGSEDAIITASRIMWSMAATKVIEKEQHHSTSDGWRSATTWNEQETDKCWEEVTSILTGELVIDVPTTYVSENHGCVVVHRGTNFPPSGSDAESNETECVRMAHSDTKIMPRIKPTWCGGETKGKRNSCRGVRWSLQGSEWKSNSKHVDDMVRLWSSASSNFLSSSYLRHTAGALHNLSSSLHNGPAHNRSFRGNYLFEGPPFKIGSLDTSPIRRMHSTSVFEWLFFNDGHKLLLLKKNDQASDDAHEERTRWCCSDRLGKSTCLRGTANSAHNRSF